MLLAEGVQGCVANGVVQVAFVREQNYRNGASIRQCDLCVDVCFPHHDRVKRRLLAHIKHHACGRRACWRCAQTPRKIPWCALDRCGGAHHWRSRARMCVCVCVRERESARARAHTWGVLGLVRDGGQGSGGSTFEVDAGHAAEALLASNIPHLQFHPCSTGHVKYGHMHPKRT